MRGMVNFLDEYRRRAARFALRGSTLRCFFSYLRKKIGGMFHVRERLQTERAIPQQPPLAGTLTRPGATPILLFPQSAAESSACVVVSILKSSALQPRPDNNKLSNPLRLRQFDSSLDSKGGYSKEMLTLYARSYSLLSVVPLLSLCIRVKFTP